MKKASLSLSINAVVILVLAIAMLGLGLGFTKKMFNKFGDTLTVPEPDLYANEDNPIVLISDTIEIQYAKHTSLPIRYFVSGLVWTDAFGVKHTVTSGTFIPRIQCTNSNGTMVTSSGAEMPIDDNEQKTFRIIIPKNFVDKKNALCTVYMDWDKDFVADSYENTKQVALIVSGVPAP